MRRLPTLVTALVTALAATAATAGDTLELNPLTVTGTRTPRLLKDTPVQTRVITATDISRSDATNIEDLLQQEIPGIEFTYSMNQQTHMNFGGYGGQGILFLVDGERPAGETMDDVDFSRLTMNNVERVEIVRGASSAIYGSSAAGGVVNVITRRPDRPFRLVADGRIGRHLDRRVNLSVATHRGRTANTLSATYSGIKNYDVKNGPSPETRVISTIYGSRTWNFADRVTIAIAKGLEVSARAGYYFKEITRVHDVPERYRDYSGGLSGQWNMSDADELRVSYSFDQYDKSDFRRATGRDIRTYSNVQNTFRALYSHTCGSGDVITAGADYCHDYLLNTRTDRGDHRQNNVDAFVQYDLRRSRVWEAVATLRYDHFSDGSLNRLTPRVSVRYRPVNGLDLRVGYGMGFRAPTLKEKYYDFDMAGIWIVRGNPLLKPESSHNVNISADYTRRNWNVTASAYYNHVNDRISTGLPYTLPGEGSQLYLSYINLRGYSIAGADVTVQAVWNGGFSAKASYAFTHERTARDRGGNRADNRYLPSRPHALTLRGGWTHSFGSRYTLGVELSGRWLSAVSNNEYRDYYDITAGTVRVRYPGYTIWKLATTHTIGKRVKVTLTADNLLNYRPRYYYLNAPLTDGISLRAGVSVTID